MNFIEKIVETIKNPKSAMKHIAEQPMIEEAVMIVGILAVIGALVAYVQSYKFVIIFENLPPSMGYLSNQSLKTTISIVSALISPFIGWLVGTGVIHLISVALGGEGKFYPQMMTVAGYSMIPKLFEVIISLALFLMVAPVTVIMDITDPMAAKALMDTPYSSILNIIGRIMELLTAVIMFYGVKNSHKLSSGKSAFAVGIPLVFSYLLMLWNLWNLGML